MEIEIRRVHIGDAPILARIQTESWKAAFAHILDPKTLKKCTDVTKALRMYDNLLEKHIGNGYLLLLDGEPQCIAWWDTARDEKFSGKAELICIHSLPEHWHCGCGRSMMERVLSDISSSGYPSVMLWVFRDNFRARDFYEASGFSLTKYTQQGFGTVELCYEKDLRK